MLIEKISRRLTLSFTEEKMQKYFFLKQSPTTIDFFPEKKMQNQLRNKFYVA